MTERDEFEAVFSKPPFEFSMERYDDYGAWPCNYRKYHVQCAWEGWQAARAKHTGWREHSKNFAKGETPPQTIESLQAAWDRDQELIDDMRMEISRLKEKVNQLRQARTKPVVPDGYVLLPIQDALEYLDILTEEANWHLEYLAEYRPERQAELDENVKRVRSLLTESPKEAV